MIIEVINKNGAKVSSLELDDKIYGEKVKNHLIYEVVKMQRANRRAGTASTKTKGLVSGGGTKPWKQKGTGRARSGSIRSPLWRHGGTVFGPHPRDYSYSVPKQVMKSALKSAVSFKLQKGMVKVFDSLDLDQPKSKSAFEMFRKAGLDNALIVIEGDNRNLDLAVRNLKDFKVIQACGLNVYDVLKYKNLVMTRKAFEKVGEMI